MFDFDFGSTPSRDAHGGAAADDSDASPTSALDNVDLSEVERRLEGALAGFDVPVSPVDDEDDFPQNRSRTVFEDQPSPTSSPSAQCRQEQDERSSSVWEDGEKFWDSTSLSTIPGSSPSDAEKLRAVQTPRTYSPVRGGFGSMSLRAQQVHMHMQARPVSGVMAMPKSLYDADGFLRT